ncbi:hypothetical protein GCM10009640_19920 [Agrococcus citreus]|uniref:Uncharacterized protein n=1 Tax=Agrococcus citreus TaxID=84643 RepID=A0ABN1YWI9_9MICO
MRALSLSMRLHPGPARSVAVRGGGAVDASAQFGERGGGRDRSPWKFFDALQSGAERGAFYDAGQLARKPCWHSASTLAGRSDIPPGRSGNRVADPMDARHGPRS